MSRRAAQSSSGVHGALGGGGGLVRLVMRLGGCEPSSVLRRPRPAACRRCCARDLRRVSNTSTTTVTRTDSPAPATKIAIVERVRAGIPAAGVLGGDTTKGATIWSSGTRACCCRVRRVTSACAITSSSVLVTAAGSASVASIMMIGNCGHGRGYREHLGDVIGQAAGRDHPIHDRRFAQPDCSHVGDQWCSADV